MALVPIRNLGAYFFEFLKSLMLVIFTVSIQDFSNTPELFVNFSNNKFQMGKRMFFFWIYELMYAQKGLTIYSLSFLEHNNCPSNG